MDYQARQKRLIKRLRSRHEDSTQLMSVVPMQKDYASSGERCLTLVAFPPARLSQRIVRSFAEPLRDVQPDHHFFAPDALHLTIKNIRKLADPPTYAKSEISRVHGELAARLPRHRCIEFSLEEFLLLDTSISLVGYCDGSLLDLVRDLDEGLAKIGLEDDKQYASSSVYFGNVTFCRFTSAPNRAFLDAVAGFPRWKPIVFDVRTLHLVSCNAICAAATRTCHHRYSLAGR